MWRAITALILLTAGCATPTPPVKRIVLLAPFEGTYREVGYDTLYPVKLALADEARLDVHLISVDDGGSVVNSILRARALAADSSTYLALVVGPIATDPAVLDALQDIPVLVIGEWSVRPEPDVFVLASDEVAAQVTSHVSSIYEAAALSEATGGEIFGLKAFADLSENTSNIVILTSAALPSPAFRERLLASNLYVPEPGLLATVAYDAGTLAARTVSESTTRVDVSAALRQVDVEGISGQLRFNTDGYWADASVYRYRYTDGVLTLAGP